MNTQPTYLDTLRTMSTEDLKTLYTPAVLLPRNRARRDAALGNNALVRVVLAERGITWEN